MNALHDLIIALYPHRVGTKDPDFIPYGIEKRCDEMMPDCSYRYVCTRSTQHVGVHVAHSGGLILCIEEYPHPTYHPIG